MITKNCLDAQKLILLKDGNLADNEIKELSSHLSKCEFCSRNSQILERIDNMITKKGRNINIDDQDIKKKKECISDDLQYKYVEGSVTEDEARYIETHINSCSHCFNELASLVRNSLSPITKEEKSEIVEMRTISAEEQVLQILSYQKRKDHTIPKEAYEDEQGFKLTISKTVENIKKAFEKLLFSKFILRPAIAISFLTICVVGFFYGRQYYNTEYQIIKAENLLQHNHRIYIENPRLSGGYFSTGISVLMSSDEEESSYLKQAKLRLHNALNKGSKSIKARQLLAQIYVIENQNTEADSIFTWMGNESTASAALINDKGVLEYQKKDWQNAVDHFQTAIKIDEYFLEAYYNLALANIKLGALDEAAANLNKYIELEHDEGWKNAAQRIINKINVTEE